MKRVVIFIMPVLGMVSTAGCSTNYWPLREDDSISFRARASDAVGEIDGFEFSASIEFCIHKDGVGWPCGPRLVPEGYDDDSFVISGDDIGDADLECVELGDIYDGIKVAYCSLLVPRAEEGMIFHGTLNDQLVATVTMPARPRPISPKNGSEISIGSDGVTLTWTPGTPDEPLLWDLREPWDSPCGDDVVWHEDASGETEDTGSFTIPDELLPKNIPPSGCRADITLVRMRPGILEPGAKNGHINGVQDGFVQVILKP